MPNPSQRLLDWAAARGYRVAWGPAAVIDVVRADVEGRIDSGEIDGTLAREQLSSFDFPPPTPDPWSAVVIAMPRPAHRVGFTVGRRRVDAVVPPTYVRYRKTFGEVRRDILEHALQPSRVDELTVPLKPLAARLGLMRYGRNNLSYISPFGSYLQLVGCLTDAPLPIPRDWRPHEPQLLEECDGCAICQAVCPTGAIADDRVLLHAERCLTFANENTAPLPEWVPARAHNALIGCLECQRHCPANGDLPVEDTGIVFSEAETAALLDGSAFVSSAWPGRERVNRLGLTEAAVIGRNLAALLAAR